MSPIELLFPELVSHSRLRRKHTWAISIFLKCDRVV